MDPGYDLNEHIQPIDLGLAAANIAEQREVTVQVFETSLAFDHDRLIHGHAGGRLTRVQEFGLIQFLSAPQDEDIRVVLALQGEVRIRTYDEELERLVWWSWDRAIKETVAIRYSADDDGMLRFTTFGGGTRISRGRIADFHTATIGLPSANARPLAIDPDLMRERCFEDRFLRRLYSIRGQVGAEGYETIDQTAFKSREYMDPRVGRMQDLQNDESLVVETFESEVDVKALALTGEITARFVVRAANGSIRIRFPRIPYGKKLPTVQAQSQAFYDLAERTVAAIVGQGLHTVDTVDPAGMDDDDPEFPLFVDTGPYRRYVGKKQGREQFFGELDLSREVRTWLPHLRALEELLATEGFAPDLHGLLQQQILYDPDQAVGLLAICHQHRLMRLGDRLFRGLVAGLAGLPIPVRSRAERELLTWSIDHDPDGWDVAPGDDALALHGVSFPVDRIELQLLPRLLLAAAASVHGRLLAGEVAETELEKIGWCTDRLGSIPVGTPNLPPVSQILRRDAIPASAEEWGRALGEHIDASDPEALDRVVFDRLGLPLWPVFEVLEDQTNLRLLNNGPGTALEFHVDGAGDQGTLAFKQDLLPGQHVVLRRDGVRGGEIAVRFRKFGVEHGVSLLVDRVHGVSDPSVPADRVAESRPKLLGMDELRELRSRLDPSGSVVGASESTHRLFESIHLANGDPALGPVLLHGDTGVGKTHVARLIHESSSRRDGSFRRVSGGSGTGGDASIQRGEWLGFGPKSGVSDVPRGGKQGYLDGAAGGTLFIDDFETLSGEVQAILLSVLENQPVDRVGGDAFSPDVRCIFATNADLEAAVEAGIIRRDLLARISSKIEIAPLRGRPEDVFLLARHFAEASGLRLSPQAEVALLRHDWPENTRQLKFTIERAAAAAKLVNASRIELAHLTELPDHIRAAAEKKDDESCATELWGLADEIARQEGFRPRARGRGLQKRVAEIMGVGATQASRMYGRYLRPEEN